MAVTKLLPPAFQGCQALLPYGYMRSGFVIALIVTVVFSTGYFYHVAKAICPIPVTYTIGQVDDRFGLTYDEIKLVLAEAESVWEDATGQNLFSYDEAGELVINFVYDDRQAFTEAASESRNELETTESASAALQAQYDQLVAAYDAKQQAHEQAVATYEAKLEAFNERVDHYNETGGAPTDVFDELKAASAALDRQRDALNDEAAELNDLVKQINDLGQQGNSLVEEYNNRINNHNNRFSTEREFTQGTYRSGGSIDIFTYNDLTDLRLVLAHEFGHALSIDHVAGSESVMYFLIENQPTELAISEQDLAAFQAVCTPRSTWDTIVLGVTTAFNTNE